MIGAATYPYDDTPKTMAMREAAEGAGLSLSLPPLAVSFSRGPGGEPVRQGEIETPAYGNIHGLPRVHLHADRRVRPRLQQRRQEHPRPHLPLGRRSTPAPTSAPATRSRASGRSAATRAAATRSRTSSTPAPTASPRSASPPSTIRCRAPGAGRRHVRHDVPAAAQPRGLARPQRGARHPLLRQRRPARLRHGLLPRRPRAATWAPTPARSSPPRSGSPTRPTATARPGVATTSRTPATRRSRPGSPRPARASARWRGRSSSATGGPSRT